MDSRIRGLRLVLALIILVTLTFAYTMLVDQTVIMEIYEVAALTELARFLTMSAGAMLIAIAVGALLVFVRPVSNAGIVVVLTVYHFARFIIDLVLIVQQSIPLRLVAPEMVYFLVACVGLIFYFPVKQEKKEETKEEKISEPTIPESPIHVAESSPPVSSEIDDSDEGAFV